MSLQASSCLSLPKYLKVRYSIQKKKFMIYSLWLHQLDLLIVERNLVRCSCVIAGINLSLLSRVMSSRLSRGTYNGGLLSTEAGTLARVVADGTITAAGFLGQSRLLNVTLLPSLLICLVSIVATCFTYNSLYWFFFPTLHRGSSSSFIILSTMHKWCIS